MEFIGLVFTHMPGGVTVGNSGLCCCVPCRLHALQVDTGSSASLQSVCAGGEVQQIRRGENSLQAASDNQTEAENAQREETCVYHHSAPWPCGPHP